MADRIHFCLLAIFLVCAQASRSIVDDIVNDAHVYSDAHALRRNRREDSNITPFLQRVWDFHQYYTWTKTTGGAEWYWQELADDAKHHKLSNSPGGYDEVKIDFEFEFYGHTIKRIYLSTAGILSMSPFDDDLPVTHYIAPFYGAFDLRLGDDSAIYFESRAERFIAEWRNVYLHNFTELGSFNFQTQVNSDGRVVFVYRKFQVPQDINVDNSQFLIGIVGSINIDIAGISILVYYDPVQVFPLDIGNDTVVIFDPLLTCDRITDPYNCVSIDIDFDCKWCGVTKRCTDGLDRYTTEWNTSGCLEEELTWDSYRIHQTVKPRSKPTSPRTQQATSAPGSSQGSSSSKVGIIVVVIVVVVIVLTVGGWIFYAYKNPTSKSGIWLMEHRPSQWKNLFASRKGFSRHDEDRQTAY